MTTVRWRRAWVPLLAIVALGGCLGEPEIEDRWTRLDVRGSSLAPGEVLAPGTNVSVNVQTAITYRAIVTGFVVTELRASPGITAADVGLRPDAPRLNMAQDIDRILANSVTMGRATRAITGWDHLIQEVNLSFTGVVPAASDSAGNPIGLFLISYLGEGEEIEQQDGSDSLIVTPFPSTEYEILPVGLELVVSGP
jgi:hypothetical protein